MKRWEELIRENVFRLGGHHDHFLACLAHMLYCIVAEEQSNLAYFFAKRIVNARDTPTANLLFWATSSSSIASKLKSPSSSISLSTNGYLNSPSLPPPRIPPPPPTQEREPMDITHTLSPITPLDIQFNTPSPPMPSPPLFGHPISWNLLEAHRATCLCCVHNRRLILGLSEELQYMFSYREHMLSQPPPPNSPPPSIPPN
ncbi:hypothetical protein Tco_0645796 [Tanacetum coccineum]